MTDKTVVNGFMKPESFHAVAYLFTDSQGLSGRLGLGGDSGKCGGNAVVAPEPRYFLHEVFGPKYIHPIGRRRDCKLVRIHGLNFKSRALQQVRDFSLAQPGSQVLVCPAGAQPDGGFGRRPGVFIYIGADQLAAAEFGHEYGSALDGVHGAVRIHAPLKPV
jgi:hypothetical protein